jgi:hypothetical protein
MKKLLIVVFVAAYCSCNTNQKTTATDPDPHTDTLVGLPYAAQYSSNFTIGSQANVLTVLNGYKAWEAGDINPLKNSLGDSMTAVFDDGTTLSASKDSVASFLTTVRDSIASIRINPDGWVSLHSVDKNEDWVAVWLKENIVLKNGKKDSAYYEEDWKLDKNGRIVFVESQKRMLR